MKPLALAVIALTISATPVFAEGQAIGNASEGETAFNKCKVCHSIIDNAGKTIQKGGRVGPNLYGIANRRAGTYEGFRYGKSLAKAGKDGLIWDPEKFVSYTKDPKAFLVEELNDKRARTSMTFKLKSSQDAQSIWAYLVSVGPDGGH